MDSSHVTLAQLRCLRAVVEQGGFVAASAHLHLSQSAVSHAVKALEEALGAPLLLRGHRGGVALTAAGGVALAEARTALAAVGRMVAGVAEAAGARRLAGTLRVGVVQSAAVRLLPDWLRRLRADHPGIAVILHEGTDPEVTGWVEAGIAEVGVTSLTHPGLAARPVFEDDYLVVVPDGHPLAPHRAVGLRMLNGHRMLLSGGGCETLIQELLAAAGSHPEIVGLVRDNATLAEMVRGGLGLTIMPELALPTDRRGLRALRLRPALRRTLHRLTVPPERLGPLAEAFVRTVAENTIPQNG